MSYPTSNAPGYNHDYLDDDPSRRASARSSDGLRPPDSQTQSNDATGDPKAKRIACVLCRRRKLRCDGHRPTCGTCKRLSHECAYDEVRRKSGPKRGYVKALEARLRAYLSLIESI